MARKAGEPGGAWQWSRTAQTRRVLLDAAREVFAEHGFTEASVATVVERAGSSVGSLYHHFGGKTELYLALWEDHQASLERQASAAVAGARAAGETDAVELLVAGSRAFLTGSWQHRDLVLLFMNGDGPPGFEMIRRARNREWLRQNAVLLGAGTTPADRLTVSVLTAVIGEAGREIATCATKRQATRLTDQALTMLRRLDPQ
jgi:AcrR family transcriptional regulator